MGNSTPKTTLYRYFDDTGQLLYVGITGDNTKRQSQHRRNSFWFGEIASASFQHFENREAALDAETLAIQAEKPLHNIAKTESYDGGRLRIQLGARIHLIQMLSEPEGGHNPLHAEWAKEVKSWIQPHDCFDLAWDSHFILHLMEVEGDYTEKKREKLPNHKECDLCIELFESSWYVNTPPGLSEFQWKDYLNER
jgi:predicted GIY-YIG superfamily endonuclease